MPANQQAKPSPIRATGSPHDVHVSHRRPGTAADSLNGPEVKLKYRPCPHATSVRKTLKRQLDCKLTEGQISRFETHVFRCVDCQAAWLSAFSSEFENDPGQEGDFGEFRKVRRAA